MEELAKLKARIQHWRDAAVSGQARMEITAEYRNYLQGRASMAQTIMEEIQQIIDNGQ